VRGARPISLSRQALRGRIGRAALAVLLATLGAVALRGAGNDLRVFQTAALRFWEGTELYRASDGFYVYRYAPGTAVLFTPLAPAPHAAARVAWMAVTVALTLAVEALLSARLRARTPWAPALAIVALVSPLVYELQRAQTNVLVLALVLLAFRLEDAGRPGWAGAVLAGAIALKVTPVILVLDWALRRRGRAVAGVALGLLAIAALPALTYGPGGAIEEHLAWIRSELGWSGEVAALRDNQSVWALAGRLGAGPLGAVAAAGGLLAAALGVRDDPALRRGLLLLAIPLASPYGWTQNFVLAIPLTAELLARRPRVRWPALALAASTAVLTHEVIGRRSTGWAFDHTLLGIEMLALFVFARAAAPGGAPVLEGAGLVARLAPGARAPDAA
jgi:hypothetical protein